MRSIYQLISLKSVRLAGESMKLERNEIDSDKETRESRNYDTLFGNGLATTRTAIDKLIIGK